MLVVLKPRHLSPRETAALTALAVALARQYQRVAGGSGATRYWKRRVRRLEELRRRNDAPHVTSRRTP